MTPQPHPVPYWNNSGTKNSFPRTLLQRTDEQCLQESTGIRTSACCKDKAAQSSLEPEKKQPLSCAWRARDKEAFASQGEGGADFPTCPISPWNSSSWNVVPYQKRWHHLGTCQRLLEMKFLNLNCKPDESDLWKCDPACRLSMKPPRLW